MKKFFQFPIFIFRLFMILSGAAVLFSCNNFLDGGDFKEQLDKDIAYANSSPYEIRIECDEGLGSITSVALLSKKVTDEFNVEFKIASGVQFVGWKAFSKSSDGTLTELSSAYINFSSYNTESSDGIYKASVKFVKGANGIVIKPYCYLLPKVTEISPEFTASGVDQDSIIKIRFNKAVNPESFGDFSCVSVYSAEGSLMDYFETPYFSSDNKVLFIQPKQDLHIITPDSGKKVDVSVLVNFSGTTDCDGLSIIQNEAHNYRIKESYGNQQKIKFLVKKVEGTGSFLLDGQMECTVGYTIDLQFTVNKADYNFKRLEAVSTVDGSSRGDVVSFTPIESNSETGIYKIRVKITDGYDDILIQPVCVKFPRVTEITPAWSDSGCDQDTNIKIKFNKPVDETTFDLSLIKIKSGGENLSSYYGTPVFSEDKTTITIPTDKTKKILSSQGSTKDITVSLDFTGAKDKDDMEIAAPEPHKFRINAHTDDVKPVLNTESIKIWIDSEKSKQLSDKAFENWSSTQSDTYKYGDYSQNHIRNTIYFEFTGTDEGSGISHAVITETHFRNSDDTPSETATVIPGNSDVTKRGETYSASYTLQSQLDGIVKLEIRIADYSNNVSVETKTYYVIKDTAVTASSISFEENAEIEPFYHTGSQTNETANSNYEKILGICNKMGKNVTLTPSSTEDSSDIFYLSYTGTSDYDIYWGYSESEAISKATKNQTPTKTTFTFEREPSRNVYLKIIFKDEVGNEKELRRIIPAVQDFQNDISFYGSEYGGLSNCVGITQYDDGLSGDFTTRYYYLVKTSYSGTSATYLKNYAASNYNDCYLYSWSATSHSANDDCKNRNFTIHLVKCLIYTEGSNKTYWYSPVSEKYADISVGSYPPKADVKYSNGTTVTPTNSSTYINSSVNIKSEPDKTTGTCKLTLSGYEKNSSGVKYTFRCYYETQNERYKILYGDNIYDHFYISSTEPVLYIPSPARKCKIYVEAQTESTIYTPESPLSIGTVSGEGITKTDSTLFSLSTDLSPLNLSSLIYETDSKNSCGVKITFCTARSNPHDSTSKLISVIENSDIYLNSNGNVEINYYFIPNLSDKLTSCDTYTVEQLINTYSSYQKTLCFNKEATEIIIPYSDIDEGFYTLCILTRDQNENYSVWCTPALNRTLGKDIGSALINNWRWTSYYYYHLYIRDSDDYPVSGMKMRKFSDKTWTAEYSPSTRTDISYEYFDLGAKDSYTTPQWVKITKYNEGDTKTSGAYNVMYAYADYGFIADYETYRTKTCSSKNTIEGGVGMQIYCDASVFVHTVYSARKFTNTHRASDAKIWETKGMEASAMVHTPSGSESFTYPYDIYEDNTIPDGVYYTTIVHFADGTVAMGEIKQK